MEEEEEKDLELRSEEVKEIMGTPPRWIVRWGSTLAAFVVALLFFMAWVIPYNDVLVARVELTTAVPPVEVIAKVDGELERLFVKESDVVRKNNMLAVMNSTGEFDDILILEEELDSLQNSDIATLLEYIPNQSYQIGELQGAYSRLVENFESYNRGETTNYDQQAVAKAQNSKNAIRRSIDLDKSALKSLRIEWQNERSDLDRVQKLYIDGIASRLDLEKASSALKSVDAKIQTTRAAIASKEQQMNEIDRQILSLQQNKQEKTDFNYVRFTQEIQRLQSDIESWKDQYLLKAPIDGKISFPDQRTVNQYIKKGEPILNIIPEEGGDWMATGQLPVAGSGKVEEGQRVILKFDSYPFQEYGTVEGIVQGIAVMPHGNTYELKVALVDGLNTSYKEVLSFNQGMTGNAEIVTAERRTLQVLFDKLISRVRNN